MRRLLAIALAAWTAAAEPPPAISWNERGLEGLLDGKPEEAARAFEEALLLEPENPVLERNLAAALSRWAEERRAARRPAEALRLLEQAVRLHPTRLAYRVLLGRARFEAGDDRLRAAAREDFAHVLLRDKDHVDALVNLGQIEYLSRELEAAALRFRRAHELRPDDADIAERLKRAERELEVERLFAEVQGQWFLVRYSPAIPQERAQAVLVLCEEARGRLSATYGSYPPRIVVTLYTPGEFRSATHLHGWVAGLSDGTIRLTLARKPDDAALRATIVHEMTHHIVREIAPLAPVWLHEGLAQIEEGRSAAQAEERLREAGQLTDALLGAEILRQDDARKVALFYDAALAFTRYLDDGRKGSIAQLLRAIGAGKDEAEAFREIFGETREIAFERWKNGLK